MGLFAGIINAAYTPPFCAACASLDILSEFLTFKSNDFGIFILI